MGRDLALELDEVRAEVRELARAVNAWAEGKAEGRGEGTPLSVAASEQEAGGGASATGQTALDPRAQELARRAAASNTAGLLTYYGYFGSGDRAYYWAAHERTAEELLGQDNEQVGRTLAALGNRQRLALLKALLEQPASAAELVERLEMGTTGQVYHHLNVLQAADLLQQEERGRFAFKGHRIPAFLLLLAGVQELVDPPFSSGTWGGDEREAR